MQIRRLVSMYFLTTVLTACAEFYGMQPPAPVFGGRPGDNYGNNPALGAPDNSGQAVQQPPQPPPVIETKPLEGQNKAPEMVEIKPEFPPVDEVPTQPDTAHDNPFGTEQSQDQQPLPESEPTKEEQPPEEAVKPEAPALPQAPKGPEALEPLETFAPQSPAIGSLVMAANEESQGGNLDSAVASIERAIRIEPRNATLYYKLAVLRLKQSKPRLAEDLARKAALLAVNDNSLKKHSWLLIANARELQNNVDGAKKAKEEAAKY